MASASSFSVGGSRPLDRSLRRGQEKEDAGSERERLRESDVSLPRRLSEHREKNPARRWLPPLSGQTAEREREIGTREGGSATGDGVARARRCRITLPVRAPEIAGRPMQCNA